MAEYCEKCLIEILEFTPEQAKAAVKVYKEGKRDLCEGCGKIVVMRREQK